MAIIKSYRELNDDELESAKELLQYNYKRGMDEYLSTKDEVSTKSTDEISDELVRDMLERLKGENMFAFFDSDLGTIFGFIIGRRQEDKGVITDIYVDYADSTSKKNTTLELFKRLLTEFQSKNVQKITTTVDTHDLVSNEVVEKLGFTSVVTSEDMSCYEKRI